MHAYRVVTAESLKLFHSAVLKGAGTEGSVGVTPMAEARRLSLGCCCGCACRCVNRGERRAPKSGVWEQLSRPVDGRSTVVPMTEDIDRRDLTGCGSILAAAAVPLR